MNRVLLRHCVAGMCLAWVCSGVVAAQDGRSVLVLYSEQWLGPATTLFTQSLRESLASSTAVVLEAQHLDISRFAGEEHDRALADWLRSRYRDRHLASVVALGVPASAFALRYGELIWPGARIIHTSIDGDQVQAAIERGDPVIPRRFEYRQTVEYALQQWPAVRQVWLIAGATEQDRRWLSIADTDLAPLNGRIHIERITDLRWDDLLAKVSRMPEDAIAVGVVFGADADGRAFVIGDAILDIARVANRPFFVVASWSLGTGAIGGYVVDGAEMGRLAARVVLRTLDNPEAANPPREDSSSRWMFDAAQLRRWNIAESGLPVGSLVLNRELPAWRRYLWPLVATALVVAAQGAIIGALLVQRRNRRRVEAALRASEGKARASYHEVRELAGRLITAREEEGARIARDLHDDIGQRVASLSIGLSRAQRQIPEVSNPARQALSTLEQQTTQLSADLRHLSHELHPSALEHLGLLEALRDRCDDFHQQSGVAVRLDVSDAWRDVSDAFALCLYRVAQEALRNVATHARAHSVTLSLDRLDGHLMMQVTDDGCGFDPEATRRRSGLGLVSLAERVRMLGGELAVTARPGGGTRLAVSLPAGESHAS
jgi:signal transduction histidine kinase